MAERHAAPVSHTVPFAEGEPSATSRRMNDLLRSQPPQPAPEERAAGGPKLLRRPCKADGRRGDAELGSPPPSLGGKRVVPAVTRWGGASRADAYVGAETHTRPPY